MSSSKSSAVVDFCDYFWGDKNDGFNVLYQNMKSGALSVKDLGDYIRESAKLQEENSKLQLKIVKQISSSGNTGTFIPVMNSFKVSAEKLGFIHNQWSVKLNDLLKEVSKYGDDIHKKHKQVKEEESSTLDIVKCIQDTTISLQKSKELYKQKCQELEKIRRTAENSSSSNNKELEKAETKFRKAQEDYKVLVDRYCVIREDFEKKMTLASKHFQEIETQHLVQMREFVENYCRIVDDCQLQIGKINQEFQIQLTELSVDKLLETFAITRHTGLEKPGTRSSRERSIYENALKQHFLKKSSNLLHTNNNSATTVAESCPIEFEEEKISVNSLGPPSDISDRSGNSDKLSLNSFKKPESSPIAGGSATGGSTTTAATSSSGKSTSDYSSGSSFGRLRTWSVAAHRRSMAAGLSISSSSTTSSNSNLAKNKAVSLLNLFIPTAANNAHSNNGGEGEGNDGSRTSPNSTPNVTPPILSATSCTTPPAGREAVATADAGGLISSSSPIPTAPPLISDNVSNDENPSEIDESMNSTSSTGWTIQGFLKRNKKKDKKSKGKENNDGNESSQKENMGSDGEDQRKSGTPTPEVDEEGYSKPPSSIKGTSAAATDPWADFNNQSKYDSSSDDSDDEESRKKIKVVIKSVQNGNPPISASVDELRSAIGGLEIAPIPPPKMRPASALNDRLPMTLNRKPRDDLNNSDIRRSVSQSHINQDLLGLSLHPIDNIDSHQQNQPSSSNTQDHDASFKMNASNVSSTSKEVGDIFGELSEINSSGGPTLPPKNRPSSVQREKVSNSLIALPRPPSRHGSSIMNAAAGGTSTPTFSAAPPLSNSSIFGTLGRNNPNHTGRSLNSPSSSLLNNEKPAFGTSRGPSPLTLGHSDVVPLAVAFQEVCHACFRGVDESQCLVRLIGDMMISFPAGIMQVITSNPIAAPLLFRIKNADVLESVVPNKHLISPAPTMSSDGETAFEFNMKNLKDLLKKQAEQNPGASYFNIDILKYQIKSKPGAKSCPLQLVAYWKCETNHTDLRLNYKYNNAAMAAPAPLLNVSIAVPIDGGLQKMVSQPDGTWLSESNRCLWKFSEIASDKDNSGLKAIRARFEIANGPGSQGTIAAQFNCEGTTLSGIDFELIGPGYRLSLVKKRFVSGKYICDGDAGSDNRYRYAVPPTPTSGTLSGGENNVDSAFN